MHGQTDYAENRLWDPSLWDNGGRSGVLLFQELFLKNDFSSNYVSKVSLDQKENDNTQAPKQK